MNALDTFFNCPLIWHIWKQWWINIYMLYIYYDIMIMSFMKTSAKQFCPPPHPRQQSWHSGIFISNTFSTAYYLSSDACKTHFYLQQHHSAKALMAAWGFLFGMGLDSIAFPLLRGNSFAQMQRQLYCHRAISVKVANMMSRRVTIFPSVEVHDIILVYFVFLIFYRNNV